MNYWRKIGFHFFSFVCITFLLVSCTTQQNLIEDTPQDPIPDWVSQHPIDNSYYIGIGSCNKKSYPVDFNSIAKKNALNDMASSVSVRVQGESFLNTMEKLKMLDAFKI